MNALTKLLGNPVFFVIAYFIFMFATYVLPYGGSNSMIVQGTSAAYGNPNAGHFHFLFYLHLGSLVALSVLTFIRGTNVGKKWLVIFPVIAGFFDLTPGLSLIPFVPTVMHICALIMGARGTGTQEISANNSLAPSSRSPSNDAPLKQRETPSTSPQEETAHSIEIPVVASKNETNQGTPVSISSVSQLINNPSDHQEARHSSPQNAKTSPAQGNSRNLVLGASVAAIAIVGGVGYWYYQKVETEKAIALKRQQEEALRLKAEAQAKAEEAQRLAEKLARMEAEKRAMAEQQRQQAEIRQRQAELERQNLQAKLQQQQREAEQRQQELLAKLQAERQAQQRPRTEPVAYVSVVNQNCKPHVLSWNGQYTNTIDPGSSIRFQTKPGFYQVQLCLSGRVNCGLPRNVTWSAGENTQRITRSPSCG